MKAFLTKDRLWEEAVVLEAPGRVLRIISCRDAVLCLRRYWLEDDHPTRQTALDRCELVLHGLEDPAAARESFLEAAMEAGFQINAWP